MTARFLGRNPAHVAADLTAIRAAFGDGTEAQAIWAALDHIARTPEASAYTKRRAEKAAIALGSLLDDITDADAAESGFSWNDPEGER